MQTLFDWLAVALFAGIAVLFLQRSVGPPVPGDRAVLYLPPVLLCAGANWLGNHEHEILATVLLLVAVGYCLRVLHPNGGKKR